MPPSDVSKIKNLGWRQGAILSKDLIDRLGKDRLLSERLCGEDIIVVLGHSCDITNDDCDKEPNVELIPGRMSSEDPCALYVKNPRALQLKRSGGEILSFSIHERFLVPREYLCDSKPSSHLSPKEVWDLATWVARRYVRAAFPDEFNRRIAQVEGKIHDFIKNKHEILVGIWVYVEDRELDEDEEYKIFVHVVLKPECWEDSDKRIVGYKMADKITALLQKCEKIALAGEVQILPATKFSLDDFMSMKQWDFEDLSHR